MGLNSLLVTPGYQIAADGSEPLTPEIINQIAKPIVQAAITDPLGEISYWRNGNFYSGFWTTPSGVTCPVSTETGNAANWTVNPLGASVTYKQSLTTPDLGSLYSLEIVGNTGTTDVRLSQTLSPDFAAVLRNGNVTVSGWVLNSGGASFVPVLEVWTCNTLNSFSATTLQATTSMQTCPVSQWVYVSVTFTLNVANAANGVRVSIKVPNPALSSLSYMVFFDRLQLQSGSVATPFQDDVSLFATLPTITNANMGAASVDWPNLTSTVQGLITGGASPSGMIADFGGVNAPVGWFLCNGGAVNRTTYASLFNAITIQTTGTTVNASATVNSVVSTTGMQIGMPISGPGIPLGATITNFTVNTITLSAAATSSGAGIAIVVAPHGTGDGSTTFNVPDLRGRVTVGAGQGTALTNRILGAKGGEETHVLLTAELAVHQHANFLSDPGHNHGVSDPGHNHAISDPGHAHTYIYPLGNFAGTAGGNQYSPQSTTNTGAAFTGISIVAHATGITNVAAGTGASVVNANAGSGSAHNNMQPFLALTKIIKQ